MWRCFLDIEVYMNTVYFAIKTLYIIKLNKCYILYFDFKKLKSNEQKINYTNEVIK